MARLIRTELSVRDYQGIWQYIAADSVESADRVISAIEHQLQSLLELPLMGKAQPQFAPNLRSFPVGNFVIFYRPRDGDGDVEVVRVLHAARDINPELFDN